MVYTSPQSIFEATYFTCKYFILLKTRTIYQTIFCFLIVLFIYLAVLGLCCCVGLSLVAASGDCSLIAVHGFLILVASLITEHGLQSIWTSVVSSTWVSEHGLSSCAPSFDGMWDLPGPGIKPMSPALAGKLYHWATKEALSIILISLPFSKTVITAFIKTTAPW